MKATAVAAAAATTAMDDDVQQSFWMPLWLSLLAGLSTCLGAAVVFCMGKGQKISSDWLTFSLSLAGSVMVTVSVVSILPECLRVDAKDEEQPESGYHFVPLNMLAQRCIFFGVGSGIYWLLSKCAFPEPDSILGLDQDVENRTFPIPEKDPLLGQLRLSEESDTELAERAISTVEPPLDRETSSSSASKFQASNRRRIRTVPSTDGTEPADDDVVEDKDKSGTWWQCCWYYYYKDWTTFSAGADLETDQARRAWRVAMLLFVSLAVHNFPEGLAVAASSLHSPKLGLTTTVAVALHNIPEGVAIAVPCMAARPNAPWLAFGLATLSGLAEPLGAAVALYGLQDYRNDPAATTTDAVWMSMDNVLAFVAGIMIMVAALELFPEARRQNKSTNNRTNMAFWMGTGLGIVLMVGSEMYLDA